MHGEGERYFPENEDSMAYTARMDQVPQTVPGWYPPPDDEDPAAYPLRFQWMQTLVHLMVGIGAVADSSAAASQGESRATVSRFGDGELIQPDQCEVIAREMRQFMDGVSVGVFEAMRTYWNNLQAHLKAQVEARGEIPIRGFEPFPYNPQSLRNDLVHWGAFNAIAAQNGGYRVS